MAKYYVFCKIDVDKQPGVKAAFGVGGIPDIRFLDKEGNEIGKMVGYRPTDAFIAEMMKYVK